MGLAFGHRQTVIMGLYSASQNVIAVDDQVMGCDRGGQLARIRFCIVSALGRL
jgi:hypothetical protein